ncbi:MAG: integration host factor subunit beta [Rickettsiales bacterium]|jgi:nucleoid DNA-binding protein|nr:integration host factor subunit beta [Rickettsiales bacterium]
MKRSDISRSVQVKFNRMRSADADAVIDIVAQTLYNAMKDGNRVEIRGFGNFLPRVHAPKTTTNPRTGATMFVAARRTILFRPSPKLTKQMNG